MSLVFDSSRKGEKQMKKETSVDRDALRQRAADLFIEARYPCSEAVFAAAGALFGYETPDGVVRFAAGFRKGMCCGDVCGAISGGVMALGFLLAPVRGGEAPPELLEAVRLLREKFAARNGGLDCEALLAPFAGREKNDPERRAFCGTLAADVVSDLAEIFEARARE